MKKISDLKSGDYVWGIHNINWDKKDDSEIYQLYPTEYQLQKYVILKNNLNVQRQYDVSDRYEEPQYITTYENYIEIHFHNFVYSRYYGNDYKQLTISAPLNNHGPYVDFFANYEDAKEYLIFMCNKGIKSCEEIIKKEQYKKNLYIKSLKQIE